MAETRKLAAILAADVVGYSKLAGSDEDRTLARLRGLRSDLIDPAIAAHHGRVVKRTGDGVLIEFRSVVDAVRCAIEMQNGMVERNAGLPPERRIEFRVGVHLGDVVEESDGDLMGDGINIAARLEGIAKPGGICLSEDAYRQVRDRLHEEFIDLGEKDLKNIARPLRAYAVKTFSTRPTASREVSTDKVGPPRLSIVVLPFTNIGGGAEQEYFVDGVTESLTTDLSRISGSFVIGRNTAFTYKGKPVDLKQIGRELNVRYVLEGSVQRTSSRLRVNVQLIDAETGTHIWAERFDKPVGDLFDMQDEIVARLANQLGAQLIAAEARRAPPNNAIRDYLNDNKVPQLFVGTGATKWNDPKSYPWTMGWQPSYQIEARIYASYILKNVPDAKIGMLYQNDDSGKDYLTGLRDGLGDKADKLTVATQSYETSDATVVSQILALRASGANVMVTHAIPKFAAQAIRKIHDIGWKPMHFLTNVAASVKLTMEPAGVEKGVGVISSGYVKDPTDPQWHDTPEYKEWLAWMRKYYPSGSVVDAANVYAYTVAQTMVAVLKQCGNDLTRDNLMKQAASIDDLKLPMLLPGITISTSATDFAPIKQLQLSKFDGKTFELFGDVISAVGN